MQDKIFGKKSVLKKISKLPAHIQKKLVLLIDDLKDSGPLAHHWPNYSKLSADQYHCHLARKWVACWRMEEGTIKIEVYYAGSRENAPY
jgi:mRNA-degrading endonuclease RelE of RelBE toxin-antitoxin system